MSDTNIIADLIKERGGAKVFAEAVGREPGAVRAWTCRRRIPRNVWPEIIAAYPEITLELLKVVERSA